jgi:hypothetical protein
VVNTNFGIHVAEEADDPIWHLSMKARDAGEQKVVDALKAAVSGVLGSPEKLSNLEDHPLVRRILHKYAKHNLSKGFAHPTSLPGNNSKSELIAELTSAQGTPPAVCPPLGVYVAFEDSWLSALPIARLSQGIYKRSQQSDEDDNETKHCRFLALCSIL